MRPKNKSRPKGKRVGRSRRRNLSLKFTFSVTGHRPDRLGGYTPKVYSALHAYALSRLSMDKPDLLIVGMGLGVDMSFASAARQLGIPYIAAVPFDGWNSYWTDQQIKFSESLLKSAKHVQYVSEPPYSAWKMHKRNQWMIDNSDAVYCMWDGQPYGGAYNTKTYAEGKNKTVIDLWYDWEDYLKGYDHDK